MRIIVRLLKRKPSILRENGYEVSNVGQCNKMWHHTLDKAREKGQDVGGGEETH